MTNDRLPRLEWRERGLYLETADQGIWQVNHHRLIGGRVVGVGPSAADARIFISEAGERRGYTLPADESRDVTASLIDGQLRRAVRLPDPAGQPEPGPPTP